MTVKHSQPLAWLSVTLLIIAVATTAATVLGFAGRLWWGFDLLSHLRFHYAVLLGLLLIVAAIGRRWHIAAITAVPLTINLWLIAPLFIAASAAAAPDPASTPLHLLHFNVHARNDNTQQVSRYLNDSRADLIVLHEVTHAWLDHLQHNMANYQLLIADPIDSPRGIAMFKRTALQDDLEVTDCRIVQLAPHMVNRPTIEGTIRWHGRDVALLAVHPSWPIFAITHKAQQMEMQAVSQWVQQQDKPVIVIGDLNTTAWSSSFAALTDGTGLIDSQRGRGVQSSWPTFLPTWAGIAIDHCLHSRELVTVDRTLGPAMGSDHRPLHVTLRWGRS